MDLSFCNPVFIDWVQPVKKETLPAYALRLKEQLTEPDAVVVGVSFGGMLATEMAKADPSVKAIIISSNKLSSEFPGTLRVGKYLPLYKWVPPVFLKKGSILRRAFFAPKGEKQKEIFKAILQDTDFRFTQWAIGAILHWKNDNTCNNITHIHGSADKLLPYRRVKADYTIQGGTHLMIMNNPEEISALLKQLIYSADRC